MVSLSSLTPRGVDLGEYRITFSTLKKSGVEIVCTEASHRHHPNVITFLKDHRLIISEEASSRIARNLKNSIEAGTSLVNGE